MKMDGLGDGGEDQQEHYQDNRAPRVPSQMSTDSHETCLSSGEIPTSSILVTNMDQAVFCDRETMDMFEHLIRSFDANARIYYFKSFSRARVDLDSIGTAVEAKRSLHGLGFGQRLLECYFFRDLLLGRKNADLLELPPMEKQFLISPPASPPVGWEPVREEEPVIDSRLIAALAALQPGESHELHPGADDKNIPAIFLLPCQEGDEDARRVLTADSSLELSDDEYSRSVPRPQITQTRRPPSVPRENDWS
ncbi:hypothetical protein RvY_06605 [Ramazzottius varieornatus]|uniref:Calcipressin n=1 Tax=Ramazzottius varieornatus TaxID=947166 RepID=A0A1D1UZ69_RAMVA|nr:hypothetical protein RvY_06605 [Ramazzottius varieornatus]